MARSSHSKTYVSVREGRQVGSKWGHWGTSGASGAMPIRINGKQVGQVGQSRFVVPNCARKALRAGSKVDLTPVRGVVQALAV